MNRSLILGMMAGPLVWIITNKKDSLVEELIRQLKEKQCNPILTDGSDLQGKPDYIFAFYPLHHPLKNILLRDEVKNVKTQVVFPYVIGLKERNDIEETVEFLKSLDNEFLSIVYIGKIVGKGMDWSIGKPTVDFDLYVVDVKNSVSEMLKLIFSYGLPGRQVVIAKKIGALTLATMLERAKGINIEACYISPPLTVSNFDIIQTAFDESVLKEASVLQVTRDTKTSKTREIHIPKVNVVRVKRTFGSRRRILRVPRWVGVLLVVFFWVIVSPFLSFFASSFFLKTGFALLSRFDTQKSRIFFEASKLGSSFSKTAFLFWGDGKRMANLLYDYSYFGATASETIDKAQRLADLTDTEGLYLMMDNLYKKISLIQADWKEVSQTYFLPDFDVSSLVKIISNGRDILANFPLLFGEIGKRSYLVLIQDSNEIRPSGGKIKSYGIVTFDKGEVEGKYFYDANSLDTKFKGSVVAPSVLAKYLGTSNWNFSDSNWEISFEDSAKRAEWFLKNGSNIDVDGVIALNEKYFDKLLNSKSLADLVKIDILSILNRKDILIYSNDESVEESIRNLGWDGGVDFSGCGSNCFSIPIVLVEANLGGTPVNGSVTRAVSYDVKLDHGIARSKLQIGFYNASSFPYKNYLRLLTSANSNFRMISGLSVTSGEFDEAGIYIEVPAKQNKQITFEWTRAYDNKISKLGVYFRKQPGVEMPLSLTLNGVAKYNTDLNEDFRKEISL